MGLKDPINQGDVVNLKIIQKKLGLGLKMFALATNLRNSELSEDEKVRRLLKIPEGVDPTEYLRTKLNDREMVTIGKFVNLDKS